MAKKWIDADKVNAALDRIREEAWLHDIPSPTVPEYIEHHDAIQQILLVIDKERKLLNDAAEVTPVRHGRWVHDGFDIPHGVDWMHCSICNRREQHVPAAMTPYCPGCGAKLDQGDNDEQMC